MGEGEEKATKERKKMRAVCDEWEKRLREHLRKEKGGKKSST